RRSTAGVASRIPPPGDRDYAFDWKSSRLDRHAFKSSARRPCAPSSFWPRRSSRGPRSRTPSDTPACRNASGVRSGLDAPLGVRARGHRPTPQRAGTLLGNLGTADLCRDDKSIIIVSAKGYVTAQATCMVQWVVATAGAGGSIYSAHMRCSSLSTPEQKTE